jgi:3-hydroxy-9,10-secoandrosta-1,3,5(10)-triene-9,17-dione monooxygenase reductase component
VDPILFRQLLGRFATGVTVLTVQAPDGRPHGMTASSLASVSLEPPLVLVCVDHAARMHRLITGAGQFVVNVLASDQEELSRRFADPHDDRFDGVCHHTSPAGFVYLDGALAHIETRRQVLHEAGDHTIVLGRVVGGDAREGQPLMYFRGGYAALR